MYYRDPTSDLVWADVPKNMSSTMANIVGINKWEKIPTFALVPKHLHIFCIIQNPWRRFCKGMAENAWLANERSFDMARKNSFYQMSFMNNHLLPISAIHCDAMPYMNYIAMDHVDFPASSVLNSLFERHGSITCLKPHLNQHVSSKRKQAYQLEVETWLVNKYPYRKQVDIFNQTDYQNWRAALRKLDPVVEPKTWYQNLRNWIFTSE